MAQAGIIDAFEFARLGKEASGSLPLARFGRAAQGLPLQPRDETGLVHWSVRGETGKQGEPLLHLHVRATPLLVCQRCMEPFVYPIDAHASLHLVKSEAELDDGLDDGHGMGDGGVEAAIDDAPEKVVGSRRFDLLEQIEDELILNIPYVPRHEVCPGAPLKTRAGDPGDGADAEKRPSPFAVLEKLKQKH
ncbi:YceD family protein [Bordetella bronchialis]|uniref:Large ribosomal RNA subunit accumulation protein YceD n=1 Tax=Bordetella bronchialis TaxID=463025 RepID=A0A193FVT8_9BORD|nr:DUF177 domain-containing protein [Bordetella bronchialis]ANN66215.1 hypothetical protein BAU06_07855 [Bordetella bronchialis]ANN71296.1 hypothetical protein BAU08_08080 [Bordetella bronchialis]